MSWSDLARPSMILPPSALPVVDGRHKARRDTMPGTPLGYLSGSAQQREGYKRQNGEAGNIPVA